MGLAFTATRAMIKTKFEINDGRGIAMNKQGALQFGRRSVATWVARPVVTLNR